jgi:hypothetical protein
MSFDSGLLESLILTANKANTGAKCEELCPGVS